MVQSLMTGMGRFFWVVLFVFMVVFLSGCKSDSDTLGSQFFPEGVARGATDSYEVVSYNISNNDTIRSDGRISSTVRKDSIALGAFTEPVFGMQKSSFVTQVRLSGYAPNFGKNPKIDSVVLSLYPQYSAAGDSVTTSTDENYIWEGNKVKKEVKTYPMYKYGKAKIGGRTKMMFNVYEVNDFLGSVSDVLYSNKQVNTGILLGSKVVDGKVNTVNITKASDGSTLVSMTRPSIRIPLDKTFFENKILSKNGQAELSNVANFIRYFKGIKVSVSENDGYIMKLAKPGGKGVDLVMYYTSESTTKGQTKRDKKEFGFDLGGSNVSFSQIEYNRSGTEIASALQSSNEEKGDPRLYVQGMGGPNFGVGIPQAAVEKLRRKFKTDKIAIISAKFRFYSDATSWNSYYEKPKTYTVTQDNGVGVFKFLEDIKTFAYSPSYKLVKAYAIKENPAYYDISITETLKNIVEKEQTNKKFILKLGDYLINKSSGQIGYYGPNIDNRVYTPNRIVLVGTDPSNSRRAKLMVSYAEKTD
ncbi:MAG: DUF4270 domain-containing protein [Bergeyella sp.]|nr:DUF4270 domain-containing protein [Bergeyella sp.]